MNTVVRLEKGRYEYRGVRFSRNSKNQIIIRITTKDDFRGWYISMAKNLEEAKTIIDRKLETHDVICYRLTVKAGN